MMTEFRDKSVEEIRCEDYAAGNKEGSTTQTAPNPAGGLFGGGAQSAPSFGQFGASAGGMGQSLFNTSSAQPAFGAASSSAGLFTGGGGFGASSAAQASGSLFSGNSLFGAQSANTLFGGQSSGAFGASATPLFGGSSGNAFGQSSAGMFSQSTNAFGGGGGQATGFGQPQSNLFGSQQSSLPTAFGQQGPQVGQNSFGASQFAGGPSNGVFGAATPSAATMFGNPSINIGQAPGGMFGNFGNNNTAFGAPGAPGTTSAPGASGFPGQGFGFGVGATPQPAQPSVPGLGSNPTLADSFNAVVKNGGTTVAPPGANYATVLYNLQKIQRDFADYKQRSVPQVQEKKSNDGLSLVVMPAPPLVRMSANRLSLHSNASVPRGHSRYGDRGLSRTPMRGVAGSIGIGGGMVSGTPFRGQSLGELNNGTPVSGTARFADRSDSMPFFTPQQFSGAKRRPLRGSELGTPRIATLQPSPSTKHVIEKKQISSNGNDIHRTDAHDDSLIIDTKPDVKKETLVKTRDSIGANGENHDGAFENGSIYVVNNDSRRDSSNFLWSAKRPSQWSKNRGLGSDDQYDPSKYMIVNNRSDYSTKPSLDELGALTMVELQHVEHFTILRVGYGSIEWLEPVDVRGLVIDDCVEIKRGEVAVFPDREASQLNAPAKVTLEGMFPKAKGDQEGVRATIERYQKKLEKFCDQNGVQFVSYKPDRGLWSFIVDDFN